MSQKDWFRKKTWTPQDREDFMARLQRSRGNYNKAQYTRIQAVELLATKNPNLIQPALELLDTVLSNWPEESSQLAATHWHRAECFILLNRIEEAVAEFRKTFEQQRTNRSCLTGAHINFAWLVATKKLLNYFDEALAQLKEFGGKEMFPREKYMIAASHALISNERGETKQAKDWAKSALEEASKTNTGFRYHPTLCLVEKPPDEKIHEQLKKMANDENNNDLTGFLKTFRN